MGIVKSLNKWANRHTYLPIDLLRIILGAFLFIKGLYFMGDSQILIDLIKPFQNLAGNVIIIHYVAPAHLVGGLLIIFGLLTRLAIVAQLPILIGAVIINLSAEVNSTDLVLAITVLLLCIFFLLYGSGKRSADYYFKMQQ
ncbi:DoxX family protein [Pontimicrobium aquaticum]|uniref:DoxX family protein n=1 Tax=Pontimicrobium aquaticum TaxID=2565367 RepID=A0A4U0EQL6_9FLAO|nr:DoxX family protein [Pontimicrobium aquaticum]TJY34005.1 DoxX family protein [Pontimicrobium aquaticum]